uniref:Tectonic n=1 Tax=Ceratitis capitata TaxID=7213 RepID=W8BIC8_CERCA
MGRILLVTLTLLLLLHIVATVKIGISRVNIDITSTTTTSTTTTALTPTDYTDTATTATTTDIQEISATSDVTETDVESTTAPKTTTTTTIYPNFTIAIFPPRLRTTKSPKIPTTTAKTTTAATISTQSPPPTSTEAVNTTTNSSPNPGDANTFGGATNSGVYYCDCDLLLDACDVNCCCDRDCMPEALNIFNCKIRNMKPQLRSRLEDFQYQHGLPSCKVNDGWLCVFRTNTRKERQKAPEIDLDTNHYFKWSTPVWDMNGEQHLADDLGHYKYNQPLQFLDMKTMTLKQFDLPNTFQPPHCQVKETVKFLKSYQTNCLLNSIEEVQLNTENTLKFIQNNKLLLKPISEASEPEQIVLSEFKLKICTKELCEIAPLNNNSAVEQRLKTHYTTEIKFIVLHNYTQLLGGLVVFGCSVSNRLKDNEEFWQTYQLEYIYKNTTIMQSDEELNVTSYSNEHATKLNSGPLGYLQGKPIIIARFIANNQSEAISHTNQVLDYFHVNHTKTPVNHTISLFTTQREYCKHETATQANVINYGISTLKQCQLRFSRERISKIPQNVRNFTEICIQLQTEITRQFFSVNIFQFGVNFPELFVSRLGRPENRSDQWTPLKVENQNFPPISGEFNALTQSFSCRNMLLNIAYEFLVGHFTEAGITQQAMVKQATLLFGERNDLEFELDEAIEVPLMVSVMFFDYAKDVYNSGISHCNAALIWSILVINFMLFPIN